MLLSRQQNCMCTVTIFPLEQNGFVLTSNRDEAPKRKALEPNVYHDDDISMWYPKDPEGRGSWIGVSSKSRAVCLLNGAFEKHKRILPYRQSRGVIVTHFLRCENLEKELQEYNLENIEPFTLIAATWEKGMRWFELVWDGEKRHMKGLPLESHIWSSSTLYNGEMREERRQWFNEFKTENELTPKSILHFHHSAGKPNLDYGVVMDRGFVKTTSITQITKKEKEIQLSFEDLQAQKYYLQTLELPIILNE